MFSTELDKAASYVCDTLCRYREIGMSQARMDVVCRNCELSSHIRNLIYEFEKGAKDTKKKKESQDFGAD